MHVVPRKTQRVRRENSVRRYHDTRSRESERAFMPTARENVRSLSGIAAEVA